MPEPGAAYLEQVPRKTVAIGVAGLRSPSEAVAVRWTIRNHPERSIPITQRSACDWPQRPGPAHSDWTIHETDL
jgi:hypothetical protein